MKSLFVLAALVAVACAAIPDAQVKQHWEGFKAEHGKAYATPAEEAQRLGIFKENLNRIAKHNELYDRGEVSFQVGVNKYADLHAHEFAAMLNGLNMAAHKKSNRVHKASAATTWPFGATAEVDWRTKGYVTPIKDQGQCGSCWSFSATGSLEGQMFKKTGKLVSLSEQNLVDCSRAYGNMGCDGGLMDSAFEYIRDNGGINTESSYPYEERDDRRCRYNSANNAATDSGYVDVNPTEKDLQDAVGKVGPVSVAIDASNWSFQLYKSGVYYEKYCSSYNLDHGVLAVGYGTEGKDDYWLVKNSWGTSWGEDGYIKMARNKKNNCGIATMASYPTV